MKYKYLFIIATLLTFTQCSKNQITLPPYNPEENLENTIPIADSIMRKMEGIYNLGSGSTNLGQQFVCKVSKRRVSFFSNESGIFLILKYGLNPTDSSIQFAGFWRYSQLPTQGNIGFSIAKDEGTTDLLLNGIANNIKLQGLFMDVDYYTKDLRIEFTRQFTQYAKDKEFAIFAHHGVQTTANPPYAENSIDCILNAEGYGVTGMEYDVRMTKDNVPICIHDPSINTRLTVKGPLSGDWDQYNFSLISDFIRLRDGQKVPSVAEALDAFIYSTTMKYMWLDVKGNPGVFRALEPIVRNAYVKAAAANRDIIIFMDIPSIDVTEEYQATPSCHDLPAMCELSLQDAIDNGAEYFGPRYSEGLLLPDVDRAHSLGIKVFSWTLNDKSIIRSYLQDGRFDGFITDYPAYVVYDFYTMF